MATPSMPAVSLDQGPPLPPNLQPPQQASMQQLAGQPGAGANTGSAALQAQVVQKLMFVESTLNDIATMMPAAAPAVGAVINLMRQGMGAALAKGATPPPAAGPPSGQMMLGTGGAGMAPGS